jgi:cytochrome c oxidase subunit 2
MPAAVRRLLTAASALVFALVLAGAASAGNGGFAPPAPQSPNGRDINTIYYVIFAITAVVFVIVEAALVVFIVRFRSRGRSRSVEGPQITGHTRLELIWTVIPVLTLAAIAAFVFVKLPAIKDVPAANAADRLNIKVEARQFYWQYTYPNGAVAIDRMVVPAGRVVTLDIVSPDVAHSWWVPAFGGKTDAIPGHPNHTWFKVDRVGTYEGQCAELCGLQHAMMLIAVDVRPPDQYASWVADQGRKLQAPNAQLGEEEFTGVCAKCHYLKTSGPTLVGPNIGGSPTLTDPNGLGKLVRNGQNRMPAVGKGWSDVQVKSLVQYFKGRGASSGG